MKVRIVYLAAGNSRRFCNYEGEQDEPKRANKLLYLLEDREGVKKPLYQHLLKSLVRIAGRYPQWELCVVSQYEELLEGARTLWKESRAEAEGRLHTVFSPGSRLGASYSIAAGMKPLFDGEEPEAYAFFVADQPFLTEESAEEFLRSMEETGAVLGCVRCKGQEGNPGWFAKDYREELLNLQGDAGGRKILKAYQERVSYYEMDDPAELRDIDEWSDVIKNIRG